MLSFYAVFNSWNCTEKDKDKSNYRFPSIVKNNGKEDLKLSKAKDLTETELERTRTRTKIMLSASPLIGFLTKSSQYHIWKANTYSILANGNRTWIASVAVIHWNLKVLWSHLFWT